MKLWEGSSNDYSYTVWVQSNFYFLRKKYKWDNLRTTLPRLSLIWPISIRRLLNDFCRNQSNLHILQNNKFQRKCRISVIEMVLM